MSKDNMDAMSWINSLNAFESSEEKLESRKLPGNGEGGKKNKKWKRGKGRPDKRQKWGGW